MKFSSKSGSFPYTLYFCQLVLFSFAAAYGVTWLLRPAPVVEKQSILNRRQLFRNYRILTSFLAADSERTPVPGEETIRKPPLLEAVEELGRAEALFAEKKHSECLKAIEKVPPRFQFLMNRRDSLRLKALHATGRTAEFIARSDGRPPADLETAVLRLDALLKSRNPERAFVEFKPLFATHRLEAFSQRISRPQLTAMTKRLGEDDWFRKFSFLLENGEGGEFRREVPYSRFDGLNRLFQAEFAYLARSYDQARRLLQKPLPEKYRTFAEAIRIKIDVRENPTLEIDERLKRIDGDSRRYPKFVLDLAQILTGKGEFARALPLYERYMETSSERDETYWKAAWSLAWLHYRRSDKEGALKYFHVGSASPIPGYRIASRYWQAKIEGVPPPPMTDYPFSYYAVKVRGSRDGFKGLSQEFLLGIDDPPGARFLEIVEDLKTLIRHNRPDETAELIHWAKADPRLGAGDVNLLKLIESLVDYRRNQCFAAYRKFRGNFRFFERVHLPHFLSGLFFPRRYENVISIYGREQGIDPNLALALIREESFFRNDVKSPANACGLMQLLLGTARQVAAGSGLTVAADDLYDPETNIRLGLSYLKSLLDRYDGRLYLALAAYNAGPHRVDRWLQDFRPADEEEFIEMIPFSETRNYVKNILRNYFFYRYYCGNGQA